MSEDPTSQSTDDDEVPGSEPMYSLAMLVNALRGREAWHRGVRAALSLLECAWRNWQQSQEDFVFHSARLPVNPDNNLEVADWLEGQLEVLESQGRYQTQLWSILVPVLLRVLQQPWTTN